LRSREVSGIWPGFMRDDRTLLRGEVGYPTALARINGAPERLRVRGDLCEGGARRIAIVGTRAPDTYGLDVATRIATDLARAGVSIVSGGAEGIDAAAHRAALSAGGHTVAVFGCGLDVTYPAAHRELFGQIVDSKGALVSEYEDGERPTHYTFPRRNRIVSGLSEAVLVVRAGERSGALLTADWAFKQGVPVFAVPGNVGDSLSAGPIHLLRRGARVAACADDILRPMGLQLSLESIPVAPERPALVVDLPEGPAAAVLEVLGRTPRHADEVARAAGLESGSALAALLDLELQGLCEQRPGQYFVRRG
jgi:DNA processing protein